MFVKCNLASPTLLSGDAILESIAIVSNRQIDAHEDVWIHYQILAKPTTSLGIEGTLSQAIVARD